VCGDDKKRIVWYRRVHNNPRMRRHLDDNASPWKKLQRKENDSLTGLGSVLDCSVP
jgi:hypothetical protein